MPLRAQITAPRRALGAGVGAVAVAVVLVGALEAWTFRDTVGPDGVAYLDVGDAYLAGHFGAAINAYWSPLYSLLVGAALKIVPVASSEQFAVAHGVNLALFLGALAAFAFFMRQLERYREAILPGRRLLPRTALWLLGLVAFGWGVGRLITADIVTPDLLVAAIWFVAMGLLLRALLTPASSRALIALGAVLGAGYLAKTAVLPVGLSFVPVVAASHGLRRSVFRGALVLAALLAVSLPFIVAISIKAGEPTIGTSSKLNYAWYDHGTPPFAHLPTDQPGRGLRHVPRKLLDRPPVFAFDKQRVATFPLWFDPSYWYAGTKPSFQAKGQVDALKRSGSVYLHMLRVLAAPALLAGILVLLALGFRHGQSRPSALVAGRFLIPPLFGLLMYAVVHVEGRFVGAFLATSLIGCYSLLAWPGNGRSRIAAIATVVAVAALGVWSNTRQPIVEATHGAPAVERVRTSATNDERAASALEHDFARCRRIALALPPIALVQTYFPRLARARIVTAVTRQPPDWKISPSLRVALARSPADILVARAVPAGRRRDWSRLGASDFFVYRNRLRSPTTPARGFCGSSGASD